MDWLNFIIGTFSDPEFFSMGEGFMRYFKFVRVGGGVRVWLTIFTKMS